MKKVLLVLTAFCIVTVSNNCFSLNGDNKPLNYEFDKKRVSEIDRSFKGYALNDWFKVMQNFDKYNSILDSIEVNYKQQWSDYEAKNGTPDPMLKEFNQCKKDKEAFIKNMKAYTNAGDLTNKYLNNALKFAEECKKNNKMTDVYNKNIFKTDIKDNLNYADVYIWSMELQKGATSSEVAVLKERKLEVSSIINQIKNDLLATVASPVNEFVGAEKTALIVGLKSFWTKKYSTDKILGVYLIESTWDRQTNAYTGTDKSWIFAQVVVEAENGIAYIYEASIEKDHNKGNKIFYDAFEKALGIYKGELLSKNVK